MPVNPLLTRWVLNPLLTRWVPNPLLTRWVLNPLLTRQVLIGMFSSASRLSPGHPARKMIL